MAKNIKDRINPNATKHSLKFGWCTTNQHRECRKMYTDWNQIMQECSCECHGGS